MEDQITFSKITTQQEKQCVWNHVGHKTPMLCVLSLSRVRLFESPWTAVSQASVFKGTETFSRQEYWRGQPLPSPGDLSNQGIEPRSPALQADTLLSEPPGKPKTLLGRANDEFFVIHILLEAHRGGLTEDSKIKQRIL